MSLRIPKVPVVMQMEALECGAACLAMILAYYGRWVPLEQLRQDCGVSRSGSTAKNLLHAARAHGLSARGFRMEPEELKQEGTFPCIVHWEFKHFVVVRGFKRGRVYLNDPARGDYHLPESAFDLGYTGVCLFFGPTEEFEITGSRESLVPFVRQYIKGEAGGISLLAVTTMITTVTGLIGIGLKRLFVDQLLTGRDPGYLAGFTAVLVVMAIIEISAGWIGAVYGMRIKGKLVAVGSASFLWHILRLPLPFFAQRTEGDIRERQAMNEAVAESLVGTIAPLFFHSVVLVVYLALMLRYSLVLTAIGVCGLLCNILVARMISAKRVNITRVLLRDEGKLASAAMGGIRQIESIKASGAENGFFEYWAGFQASVNRQKVRYRRLDAGFGSVPKTISILVNVFVFAVGIHYVMTGRFTVGMVMAFGGFLEAFMEPALSMVEAGQTIQELRSKMERIRDVMEYPVDERFLTQEDGKTERFEGCEKLSGDISLSHVTFRYSPTEEPVLKDVSFSVKAGSRVAVVGKTGCGKSTLVNLLLGLYTPQEGQICFDGKPLGQVDRRIFHGSVGVIDQDIVLFGDSISANIKTWDESIEDFEMILAAKDASIHEEIMKRPEGYRTQLVENGKDFSGGQRQRLEIARILAQDPTIVIMDEATSALDAKTERDVVKAVADRGITCIVIAHRLSTIRECDMIIVLQEGAIVESGTHDQLMRKGGIYRELVSCDG